MKKIVFLGLISTICSADQNLHRYMWANYRQFGGQDKQANQWYEEIFASKKPSVFTNRGYLFLLDHSKNYERIITLMPKLKDTFAKDIDIQLIFVNALRKTGKTTEADDLLLNLHKNYKTNPEVAFHAAEAFMRRKELKNAISTIDDYLNSSPERPNNFIFYFLKSQAYTKLNDFKKAQESIQRCLDAHPKFPQGWLLYALIQEQVGKIGKAIEGYTSYLEIAGGNKQIEQHLLSLVLQQKAVGQSKQVVVLNRSCFEKAIVLFERKDFRSALKQIDECLVQNPNDTKARLLKVEILTSLGEYDTVINQLTTWALEPSEPQIWLQALHLLSRATQAPHPKIIAALEKIHHQKSTLILPVLLLADLYSRSDKTDNAMAYLQKSLLFPQSNELKARILYQMGIIHYEKMQYSAMKQALEQVLSSGIEYPPALNLLAYYYATEGKQLDKANELVQKALDKDKSNPHFLDTKAVILYKQGKYKEALSILEPIAKTTPHDSTILIHLAKTYRKLGDLTQACMVLDGAKKCAINHYEQETTTALLNQWKK